VRTFLETWTAALYDTRYALRWFRRDRALTAAIVLTLAVGIGLNSGVFSVISGMLIRSRVEVNPSNFFQVLATPARQPDVAPHLFMNSTADFQAYQSARGVFSVVAWAVSSGRLDNDADPTLVQLVSCEFFQLYGLRQPTLGRLFKPAECTVTGTAPIVLLDERVWQQRFQSDPAAIGRTISINRRAFTIAGILPHDFAGRLRGPGIWIPYTLQAPFHSGIDLFRETSRPWLTVEGRRLPGFSRDALFRELGSLAASTGRRSLALTNGSIFEDPSSRVLAASVGVLLSGALAMILLLACTNVTMLLLARATARGYEMSVRLAVGATRGRLLRMAATEGILLAILSGGLSAAIAAALPALVVRMIPGMPHYPMHTDWIVFAYLGGITLVAGCGAALLPAAESLRTNLQGSLRRAESAFGIGRRKFPLREILVAAQVAMSLVIVVGAALFARTQYRLFVADPGFDAGHVLMAPLLASETPAPLPATAARLSALEGVRSVAFASSVFWTRAEASTVHLADGRSVPAAITTASANFFDTLSIARLQGAPLRAERPSDVVVTEASARALWPGGNAVGQVIHAADGLHWRVAGVMRESDLDRRSPAPRIFRVFDSHATARPPGGVTGLLAFDGDAATISRAVTALLESLGTAQGALPRTLAAELGEMGSRFRVISTFAVFFGATAFALALIGVYGVMAFTVSRRAREMGIRLALGATRANILREVLRSGMRPVMWGLMAGVPLAVAFAIGLQFAFRATPTQFLAGDPLAYGPIPVLLVMGAAIAMLRPALRACAADPAASLRQE
jgi:predicted permease